MDKSELLKNLEKEYCLEIKTAEVSVQDLLGQGISEKTLQAEVFLRSKYGDGELVLDNNEEVNETAKSIEKINEEDIAQNKSLAIELEKIQTDEFNSALEKLIINLKN